MENLSKFTKQMQDMLPQWMQMAKDPESKGAQFLNVFGLELEDVEQYLEYTIKNMYVGEADIGQIDIVYRVPAAINNLGKIDMVSVIKNDAPYSCEIVETVQSFYMAPSDRNSAIVDKENNYIYIRVKKEWVNENVERPVDRVEINRTAHFEYGLHHIWNTFDEFGLLLGLYRLRGEENESFKNRILDVFKNPANSTKGGLKNGLSRELGINKEQIDINELSNAAFRKTLLNEDGSPSQRLINIAKQTNEILGSTWGNMSWDEAYWHSIEDKNVGLEYLPHVWDAPMDEWKDENFQSGIGDGNDLKVRAPEKLNNKRDFKYFVGLRGKQRGTELVNPEINFKYKILAKGKVENSSYKPEDFKYTIVSSEIVNLHYIIRAYKYYVYNTNVDFGTSMTFAYDSATDPSCEIVTGQTVMSKATDQYLRLEAEMKTLSKSYTPKINSIAVTWEDTGGAPNKLVFNTQEDFDRNDTVVKTTKVDILTQKTATAAQSTAASATLTGGADAVASTGTITFSGAGEDTKSITINAFAFNFKASPVDTTATDGNYDVGLGTDAATAGTNLKNAFDAAKAGGAPELVDLSMVDDGLGKLTVSDATGDNTTGLSTTFTTNVTLSGTTLTGGSAAVKATGSFTIAAPVEGESLEIGNKSVGFYNSNLGTYDSAATASKDMGVSTSVDIYGKTDAQVGDGIRTAFGTLTGANTTLSGTGTTVSVTAATAGSAGNNIPTIVYSSTTAHVELGYGDFYYLIDYKEDFQKGNTFENVTVNNNGSIQLTPFSE